MAKVSALEVMPAFNTRSSLGRVVIEPPAKMPPLQLREAMPMVWCCGRAFLTEESYSKHQEEVEVHGKPIELKSVITAKNDRSSLAFWRSRKAKAAMTPEEASIQRRPAEGDSSDYEDYDGEEDNGNGGDYNGEAKTDNNVGYKGRSFKYKERRMQVSNCEQCSLPIPYSNMMRHLRLCHNPEHQFKCRYCSCRYLNEFGRVIHESRNHSYTATKKLQTLKKQLIRPLNPPRLKPAPTYKLKPSSSSVPNKSSISKSKRFDFQGFTTLSKHAHQCLTCNKVIKGYQTARDHMNIHKGIKPYSCPVCGYKFTHKTNMTRHLSKGHRGGNYLCENGCGYSFSNPKMMNYHRRFCTVTNAQKCSVRNSASIKSSPYSKELPPKLVKQEPAIKLDLGGGSKIPLSTIVQWQKNWTQFRSGGYIDCPVCHKQITGAVNFRDHLNMHGGIKPYSCTLCTLTFTFKCNIRRHMMQCHVPDGPFICRIGCGCRMATLAARTSHEIKCVKKTNEPCNVKHSIPKPPVVSVKVKQEPLHRYKLISTSTRLPFKGNEKLTHWGKGKKTSFTCKVCGKWLISARNLRNHMMIHLNLKPHSCGQCGMKFRSFDQIKKHEKHNHVPTGAYRCSQCPCQFETQQGLSFHVSSRHSLVQRKKNGLLLKKYRPAAVPLGSQSSKLQMPKLIPMGLQSNIQQNRGTDRTNVNGTLKSGNGNEVLTKFPCNYCDRSFQSSLNLKYHIYSHTGEKPYKCKHCGYHFRRKGTLWDHEKHSHSGGEFRCSQCTCRFHSEHGLKRHDSLYHAYNSKMKKSSTKAKIPFPNSNSFSKTTSSMKVVHKIPNSATPAKTFTAMKSGPNAVNSQLERSYSTTAYQFGSTTIAVSVPKEKKYASNSNNQSAMTTDIDGSKSAKNGISNQTLSGMSAIKSKYCCGHCGLNFETIHELSEHQMLHTKNDVDEIEIEIEDDTHCNDSTESTAQTNLYSRKEYSKGACPICKCTIHGSSHLKKHMNGCHNGGNYHCRKCPCQFHKLVSLKKHYTVSHKEDMPDDIVPTLPHPQQQNENTKTDIDFEEVDASGFFQNHFLLGDVTPDIEEDSVHESHEIEVQYEDSTFSHHSKTLGKSSPPKLAQGSQSRDPERPFTCEDCGRGFKSNWLLKMHKVVHQTTYDHKCRICGQHFKTASHVRAHMKKSHGNGKFKCSKCPSRFDTYRGLQTHNYCYHKGGREIKAQVFRNALGRAKQGLPAPSKPKSIPSKSNMSFSTVINHRPVPEISKVEVIKEPLSKILKESPKYSPKNRPIKCKICDQICHGPGGLVTHMRSHSNVIKEPIRSQAANFRGLMATTVEVVSPPSLSPQDDFHVTSNEFHEANGQERDTNNSLNENEEDTVIMDYEEDYAHVDDTPMDSCNESQDSNGHLIQYELEAFNEGNFYAGNGEEDTDDFDVDSYDCEGCGLSFTSRVVFLRHIQSSGGGPFKCTYCCAVHTTSASLQGHLELYHEELMAAGH